MLKHCTVLLVCVILLAIPAHGQAIYAIMCPSIQCNTRIEITQNIPVEITFTWMNSQNNPMNIYFGFTGPAGPSCKIYSDSALNQPLPIETQDIGASIPGIYDIESVGKQVVLNYVANYPSPAVDTPSDPLNLYLMCSTSGGVVMQPDMDFNSVALLSDPTWVSGFLVKDPQPVFSTVGPLLINNCSASSFSITSTANNQYVFSGDCQVFSDSACTNELTTGTGGVADLSVYLSCPTAKAAATVTIAVTISSVLTTSNSNVFLVYDPVSIANVTTTNVTCFGSTDGKATLTLSGGTGTNTFSWSSTTTQQTNLAPNTYAVTVTSGLSQDTRQFTIGEPDEIVISNTLFSNPSCFGLSDGNASLDASGGVGALTYSWSGSQASAASLTGLSSGLHTATVMDSNLCIKTHDFTLVDPIQLSATTVTNVAAKCFGDATGQASIQASGGTSANGEYSYSWSSGDSTLASASGLAMGTYTVTITDDHGCTLDHPIQISEPSIISLSSKTLTHVKCFGEDTGAIATTVTGGTPDLSGLYLYSWDKSDSTASSASNLAADTYVLTVLDANNCNNSFSMEITQPPKLSLFSTTVKPHCFGGSDGSISVDVKGGKTPYGYTWTGSSSILAHADNLPNGTYEVLVLDANQCNASLEISLDQPAPFAGITKIQNDAQCFGGTGSLEVAPVGGAEPFTYAWSPIFESNYSVSGVPQGTYEVTVTDDCAVTHTANFVVTQPMALELTPSQVNVACHGAHSGTATVYAQGGTSPYTYAWSNGDTTEHSTHLAAGEYSVTVTDTNNCSRSLSYVITEPDALVVTPKITPLTCFGGNDGAISLSIEGGTDRYTYSWNPVFTGIGSDVSQLRAGDYEAIIADSEWCSQVHTYTVPEPTAIAIATSQIEHVDCHGGSSGSVTVSVTGGTPGYTYAWTPSGGSGPTATGLSAGTYVVKVVDNNGCAMTHSITITEPDVLSVVSTPVAVACTGGNTGTATAVVAGGTGPFVFSWSNGATTSTASQLSAGSYQVNVTDAHSCSATTTVAISEPAPLVLSATQTNQLCFGDTAGSATVFATGGTEGYTYSWSTSNHTNATANGLATGLHVVTVTDANMCTQSHTFHISQPSDIKVTAKTTSAKCFGTNTGNASLVISGGVPTYSYSWSTGATTATIGQLYSGSYSVAVTDANKCSKNTSFIVFQRSDLLTVSISTIDNVCFGGSEGSAALTVTGLGSITYLWSSGNSTSPNATGLAAGKYSVTVMDGLGCKKDLAFNISQPDLFCQNSGKCLAFQTCSCAQGWTGTNCSTPVCALPCQNGGICTGVDSCTCVGDFIGPTCSNTTVTSTVRYLVKLVQILPSNATVEPVTYANKLADKLNISSSSINYTTETVTGPSKRDSTNGNAETFTKVSYSVSLNSSSAVSKDTAQTAVENAVKSEELNQYMADNGAANATAYIESTSVDVESKPTEPKNNHNRNVRLGAGIGLGLGLPLVGAAVVGSFVYYKKRNVDAPNTA